MKTLFRDLNAVLPAHADLNPGDGSEMVGLHLGARFRAARGGHSAAPVPVGLVLHGRHLGLGPADLQLLPRPVSSKSKRSSMLQDPFGTV